MTCLSCISFISELVCRQKTRVDLPSEIEVDVPCQIPSETQDTRDVLPCETELPSEIQVTRVDLPFEITEDILSWLPSEALFLCGRECKPLGVLTTTPSFLNAHLTRAATPTTPVIAFHHHLEYFDYDRKVKDINIHMMDARSQHIVTKSIKVDSVPRCKNRKSMPLIFGSYNGFLMFTRFRYDVIFCIWNPVTQEEVSVIAPNPRYEVRGLFFHKATEEYRLLYISFDDKECFSFYILSLKTKCTRRVQNYSHPPSGFRSPVIVNDVLHWIVCDQAYKKVHGQIPHCMESIVSFDSIREEFSLLRHPFFAGFGKLWLRPRHLLMEFMDMEGRLCFCDHSSSKRITVWILEDYDKNVWVRMYVFTEPLKMFPLQCGRTDLTLKVVHVFEDMVLLTVESKEMVLYDIKLGTFTRFGEVHAKLISAVFHVNTLAAIHTDNTVYVSTDPAGENRKHIKYFGVF